MLALIKGLDSGLDSFLDPIQHLMVNFILFLFFLKDGLQFGLGSVDFLPPPGNGVIEALAAFHLIGLIFFPLGLHILDELLVFLLRDFLV